MNYLIAVVSATLLLAASGAARAADPVELTKKYGGDCLSCHAIDKKMVGPAWKDVAARYKGKAGARKMLVEKVIKGGKGNWDKMTGGLSMPAHPTKPTRAQITEIVDAILKL